jgi:hypothetical protein
MATWLKAAWAAVFALVALGANNPSEAQVGPANATKLVFYNASTADVAVAMSVPNYCFDSNACAQEDGCPTGTLQNVKYIDLTISSGPRALTPFAAPTQGYFILKRGHRVQVLNTGINKYTGRPSACLQGVTFGFGISPAVCPDSTANGLQKSTFPIITPGPNFNKVVQVSAPNGTNGFEATINLPGTVNGQAVILNPGGNSSVSPPSTVTVPTGESIDITCVNGANCTLNVRVTPPATGPFWSPDGTSTVYRTPISMQNSWVDVANKCDNNCIDPRTGTARIGVYPYGCTECNVFPDKAPPCQGAGIANAQFCAARNGLPGRQGAGNGCKLNRSSLVAGSPQFGGTIQINYLGPLRPPGTCPPGTKAY